MSDLRPAVFLDRDGTIIEEIDYLADVDRVELIPGAGAAIRALNEAGFLVICVTNQSGVARGLVTEETLEAIHVELSRQLAEHDARIDRYEYCPHHPEYDGVDSPRRKPGSGMLTDAAGVLGIDLERSWMIGDAERDLIAGEKVGARSILVATGKGEREHQRMREHSPPRFTADLGAAVQLLLGES